MRTAVEFTPWRSIRSGVVESSDSSLTLDQALESPCMTCKTSPCCTHLPVHNFTIENIGDLSYARYVLNFDRMRLGVNRNGNWGIYYVYPCRHLDRETFHCKVHATDEQPQICVHYNAFNCWYRASMTSMASEEFLLVDRARLDVIASKLGFDQSRNIVEMPDWDEIRAQLADVSDEPFDAVDVPLPDPVYDGWRDITLGRRAAPEPPARDYTFDELRRPCDGCSAPCCETLSFQQAGPPNMGTLDFFRFALGFPGVELLITNEAWWITIKSRCQHLSGGRCSVYGRPERPMQCVYYDAWKCTFKHQFGTPVPAGALRVRFENFHALTELLRFDDRGNLLSSPDVNGLRDHIEHRWREREAAAERSHP